MRIIVVLFLFLSLVEQPLLSKEKARRMSYTVDCIWRNDAYCAFTSLIKYKGRFYCSFREGESHIFDSRGNAEGRTRIITSKDGRRWRSVFVGGREGYDLRDPKLSVTPDGRLMVIMGGSIYRNRELKGMVPHVVFSSDGEHFTEPRPVEFVDGDEHTSDWLWRITWHDGVGYVVGYGTTPAGERFLRLYSTRDGVRYDKITDLAVPDFPNETTVRFLPDGRMSMMVRRDAGDCRGDWGVSNKPFTEWKWHKMDLRLGGQDYLVSGDAIIVSSRNYYLPHSTTTVYKGDFEGRLEQRVVLPSGGDNAYPGLMVEGNELWVSYYSQHEGGRPAIYLARIPMSMLQ